MAGNTQGSAGYFFNIVDAGLPGLTRTNPELINQIGEQWQTKFDANRDYYYTVNNALSNVQVNDYDTDKQIKQEVMQMVDDAVGESVAKGEFLYLKNDLLKLADGIQKHEGLNRAISSKAARDAFIESVNKMEGWSEAEKQTHLQWVENNYDHSVRYDPETGKATGGYKGIGLSKWVDMSQVWKEAVDIASKFKASSVSTESAGSAGMSIKIDGANLSEFKAIFGETNEILTPQELNQGILAYVASKPEVQDFIRDKTRLELFNLSIAKDNNGRQIMLPNGKIQTNPLDENTVAQMYLKPGENEYIQKFGKAYLDLFKDPKNLATEKAKKELAEKNKAFLDKYNATDVNDFHAKMQGEVFNFMKEEYTGGKSGELTQSQIEDLAFLGKYADMVENTAGKLAIGMSYSKYSNTQKLIASPGFNAFLKHQLDAEAKTREEGEKKNSVPSPIIIPLGASNRSEEDSIKEIVNHIKELYDITNKVAAKEEEIRRAGDNNVTEQMLSEEKELRNKMQDMELNAGVLYSRINTIYDTLKNTINYNERKMDNPMLAHDPNFPKSFSDVYPIKWTSLKPISNVLSEYNVPDYLHEGLEKELNRKIKEALLNPNPSTIAYPVDGNFIELFRMELGTDSDRLNYLLNNSQSMQTYFKTAVIDNWLKYEDRSENIPYGDMHGIYFDEKSSSRTALMNFIVNELQGQGTGIFLNMDGTPITEGGDLNSYAQEGVRQHFRSFVNDKDKVPLLGVNFILDGEREFNLGNEYSVFKLSLGSSMDSDIIDKNARGTYAYALKNSVLSDAFIDSALTEAISAWQRDPQDKIAYQTANTLLAVKQKRKPIFTNNNKPVSLSYDITSAVRNDRNIYENGTLGLLFDTLEKTEDGQHIDFHLDFESIPTVPVPVPVRMTKTKKGYVLHAYANDNYKDENKIPMPTAIENFENKTYARPHDAVASVLFWNPDYQRYIMGK